MNQKQQLENMSDAELEFINILLANQGKPLTAFQIARRQIKANFTPREIQRTLFRLADLGYIKVIEKTTNDFKPFKFTI